MKATLYVDDGYGEFDKIGEYPNMIAAEKAMHQSYDSGKCEDHRIEWQGMMFHYPSYKLCLSPCPRCGEDARVHEMQLTHDCHGIPFRSVCPKCYDAVQRIGYDGVKYTELDENLHYDY